MSQQHQPDGDPIRGFVFGVCFSSILWVVIIGVITLVVGP